MGTLKVKRMPAFVPLFITFCTSFPLKKPYRLFHPVLCLLLSGLILSSLLFLYSVFCCNKPKIRSLGILNSRRLLKYSFVALNMYGQLSLCVYLLLPGSLKSVFSNDLFGFIGPISLISPINLIRHLV